MCTNSVFFSSDLYRVYAYIFNSPEMCTNSAFFSFNLYRACACIFNSRRICEQMALVVLTHEEVLGVRYIGENNSLRSVLVAHEEAFFVILTYGEVSYSV